MPNQLKNVQTIFNERLFRVPDYQRGYSWGKDQLEDFWHDINNLPTGRNHRGVETLGRRSLAYQSGRMSALLRCRWPATSYHNCNAHSLSVGKDPG